MSSAPSAVVMVRPHRFHPNPQTSADNAFQHIGALPDAAGIARRAMEEVDGVAHALTAAGVVVHRFDDVSSTTPDSVFPNNWITTHADGRIVLFPMYAPNRRGERRADVIAALRERHVVTRVVDYTALEERGEYLEGTGAMVLGDHERVAYVCRSRRAHPRAIERFCAEFGYRPFVFDAVDEHGVPCYHTNVMLCVGDGFALLGTSMVHDRAVLRSLIVSLESGGRDVIALSPAQIRAFAGNAIELDGRFGRVVAMSARGVASLTAEQRSRIEQHGTLLSLSVPTIELAGGSVRCMIAGVHLPVTPTAMAGALVGRAPAWEAVH